MNYSYLLQGVTLSEDKLSANGFERDEKGVFVFRKQLPNSLCLVVKTSNGKLDVDVIDGVVGKRSSAFSSGHSGSALRAEVREIVMSLIEACSAN